MSLFLLLSNNLTATILSYNISIPVYIVFRSTSLVASLLTGILLGKSYSPQKIYASVIISFGLIVMSAGEFFFKNSEKSIHQLENESLMQTNPTAYFLLLLSLFVTATNGHLQEYLFKVFGSAPVELKYYTHLLSLPTLYFSRFEVIHDTINDFTLSETIPYLNVPRLFVFAILISYTSHVCLAGIYGVLAASDAVNLTYWLTLRKFISLVISIWYFENSFNGSQWVGSLFVFLGVILYPADKKMKIK